MEQNGEAAAGATSGENEATRASTEPPPDVSGNTDINGMVRDQSQESLSMTHSQSMASVTSVESTTATGDTSSLASVATADSEETIDLPLHLAARQFDLKSVEELVKLPDETKALDNKGKTPLHHLVEAYIRLPLADEREQYRKLIDILVALTRHGVSVNQGDKKGETPIHYAAASPGCNDIIQPLVDSRGHVNCRDKSGETPLHKAVSSGLVENIGVLIGCQGDPNIRNNEGQSPLHLAVKVKRNTEVVEYLLLHGATPNLVDGSGKTPLHTATRSRRHEYVDLLIEHGARADFKDSSGQTALHVAAASDMTGKVLKQLLSRKINKDIQDDIYGETALHKAVKHSMIKNVKILARSRANPNVHDIFGATPLHRAAPIGNIVLWQSLLLCGGDVNAPDENSVSPQMMALKCRNATALALMRQYGKIEG